MNPEWERDLRVSQLNGSRSGSARSSSSSSDGFALRTNPRAVVVEGRARSAPRLELQRMGALAVRPENWLVRGLHVRDSVMMLLADLGARMSWVAQHAEHRAKVTAEEFATTLTIVFPICGGCAACAVSFGKRRMWTVGEQFQNDGTFIAAVILAEVNDGNR
jgi:hypothetical protein